MKTKQCIICKQIKPLSEYNKRANSTDGYRNNCKLCQQKRNKEYREANIDKTKEYNKKYYKLTREKQILTSRKYRKEHKEEIREYHKKYREQHKEELSKKKRLDYLKNRNNPDFILANKKYREENRERINKVKREEYLRNRDKYLERTRKYKEDHPELVRLWKKRYKRRRRAKQQEVKESYTIQDEQYTKSLFNNKCFNCGATDNLHIDHHYPLSKGHALTRNNAVLLCQHCNISKSNKSPEEFYTPEKLSILTEMLNR